MPAKELTPNDLLKMSPAASKAVKQGLTENKDYDGKPKGLPAGVSGQAKISSVKIRASEKPNETWISYNVTAMVTSPEEYRGRLVYPSFMYGQNQIADTKTDEQGQTQASKTIRYLISFLQGLGLTDTQIEKVKGSKEKVFHAAFKTIESSTGVEFNFATQLQKKKKPNDPDRVECRVRGPVEVTSSTAPFDTNDSTPSDEGASGTPAVGEVWRYDGVDYTVTAVDSESQTVDLDDGDGGTHEGLSWFHGDDAQIEFVSAA